jgi:hypothetical protein
MKLKRITGRCRREKYEAGKVRGKFILVLKCPTMTKHGRWQTGVSHASDPTGFKKKLKRRNCTNINIKIKMI